MYQQKMDLFDVFPTVIGISNLVTNAGNSINKILFQNETAENCKICHNDIYNEWKESYHGKAWTDEKFKSTTAEYKKKDCLPCHAPKPMLETGLKSLPILRSWDNYIEEGINCYSCHAKDGIIYGPYNYENIFHATRKEESLQSVEICQSCHPSTFDEWQERTFPLAKDRYICQTCHMSAIPPNKSRRISQYGPIRSEALRHDIKGAHTLSHRKEAFKGGNVSIKVNKVRLQILNNFAAHRIPTGISGRRFEFKAQMFDENNNKLDPGRRGTIITEFIRTIKGKEVPEIERLFKMKDSSIGQGLDDKFVKEYFLMEKTKYVRYEILFFMDDNDEGGKLIISKEISLSK